MTVVWPDAAASRRAAGDSVTVNLQDADLGDLYRLIADVSGLNVVVFPGVHGKVTLEAQNEPWELVLGLALSPNGLASQREDNVLLVAPPDKIPPARSFRGRRVDLDFRDTDLRKALAEIAQLGGATVTVDPAVSGSVTLRLGQVRWDQAFDIVVRVNGLEWNEEGKALQVTLPTP
jgi:type IV pilus assembly protein PilQ